jgi:hypothetical protein
MIFLKTVADAKIPDDVVIAPAGAVPASRITACVGSVVPKLLTGPLL